MDSQEDKSVIPSSRKRDRSSMDDGSGTDAASQPRKRGRGVPAVIGSFVRKNFPGEGAGAPLKPLLGKVMSCCAGQYTVIFEDGRREALNLPETRQILLPGDAYGGDGDAEELQSRKRKLEHLISSEGASVLRTRSRKSCAATQDLDQVEASEGSSAPHAKSRKISASTVVVTEDADKVEESEIVNAPPTRSRRKTAPAEDMDQVEPSSPGMPVSNLYEDAEFHSDSCDSDQGQASILPAEIPPPPPSLPASSADIPIPEDAVPCLFSVYSFLRSFSHQLFLSPFGLDDFVGSLNCTASNTLLDAVHLSLLRALRHHLEALASDGLQLACRSLKIFDWNLLDMFTWPVFLVQYLSLTGHMKQMEGDFFLAGVLGGEYYSLPAASKLTVLQILCDDVLDSAELRTELAMRENLDEDGEYNVNPISPTIESGPRRVHPRYSKTSACKDPGSFEHTVMDEVSICTSKISEADVKDLDSAQDGNSDECCLCGMDGTLICCDGCPSAYHSRCIGLNKQFLPEGSWFCPECTVKKRGPISSKVSVGIRGAEFFGIDSFGRMFLGTCNYLLVLEEFYNSKPFSRYYNQRDVVNVLRSLCCSIRESPSPYANICQAISTYWEITFSLDALQHGSTETSVLPEENNGIIVSNSLISTAGGKDLSVPNKGEEVASAAGISACKEGNGESFCKDSSAEAFAANEPLRSVDLVDTNSQESAFALKALDSNKMMGRPNETFFDPNDDQLASKVRNRTIQKNNRLEDDTSRSASALSLPADNSVGRITDKGGRLICMGAVFKPQAYINQYIHGEYAASAAAKFATLAAEENKVLHTGTTSNQRKSLAAYVTLQMRAFSAVPLLFMWPTFEKKAMEIPRERCGWCIACKSATTCKKGCMLNTSVINAVKGYSRYLGSFRSVKNDCSQISSIATYVLHMEECLHALIEGPLVDSKFGIQWRESVKEASSIRVLKHLLLELEKNIRGIVFSSDWLKPVATWSTEVSGSQNGTCFTGSIQKRRGGRGRRRKQCAVTEIGLSDCDDNWKQFQWWRGWRLSKIYFREGALPSSLAKKVARQGGSKEVPGIFYSDSFQVPNLTRQIAWRVAVEKSKNASQLAFQVRYLDAHLRWRDIARSEQAPLDGKAVDVEASAFRNAIVLDKKVVDNNIRYALAFSSQKHLPLRVTKNLLETESDKDGNAKMWFSENYTPLYLIKEYEEKKEAKFEPCLSKINAKWMTVNQRKQHKALCKDIFSYLVFKRDNNGKCSCASCKQDVILRNAVQCQNCHGYCHEHCLIDSTDVVKRVMCNLCHHVPSKSSIIGSLKKNQAFPEKHMLSGANVKEQSNFGPSELSVSVKKNLAFPKTHLLLGAKVQEHSTFTLSEQQNSMKVSSDSNIGQKNKCPTYGLIWKRKKNSDERGSDFRLKHIFLKGGVDVDLATPAEPICKICHKPYDSNLMYIRCENCLNWYHAEAVMLEEHQIFDLVGFKCLKCRRKCSPICPYLDPDQKMQMEEKHAKKGIGSRRRVTQPLSRSLRELPKPVQALQNSHRKAEEEVVSPETAEPVMKPVPELLLDWNEDKPVQALQNSHIKAEEEVVPLGTAEPVMNLVPEVLLDWNECKPVPNSLQKLPVRRHANAGILHDVSGAMQDANVDSLQSSENASIPYMMAQLNHEVDMEGFSIMHEANPMSSAERSSCSEAELNYQMKDENVDDGETDSQYLMIGSQDARTDDMDYGPQTYFSFTELLSSGDDQLDYMITADMSDDWRPLSGFNDNCDDPSNHDAFEAVPGANDASDETTLGGLECEKCKASQPPPDLLCEICGLIIHSHCSPWVETEEFGSDKWRCGSCREWR